MRKGKLDSEPGQRHPYNGIMVSNLFYGERHSSSLSRNVSVRVCACVLFLFLWMAHKYVWKVNFVCIQFISIAILAANGDERVCKCKSLPRVSRSAHLWNNKVARESNSVFIDQHDLKKPYVCLMSFVCFTFLCSFILSLLLYSVHTWFCVCNNISLRL